MKIFVFIVCVVGFSNGWLILQSDLENYNDKISRYGWGRGLVGKPLILSEYINRGEIEQARKASSVEQLFGNIESYAGFFTVNETYNSNMYWWYFPAEESPETAPVILWLQGGPGGSSLYGLFNENGPYTVDKNGNIGVRDVYWSKTMHVLYIDNPVGSGFSFTNDEAGFSTNEEEVGENLYRVLQQFFTVFPELRSHEFFVSGESYAGKYIPALGYTIHKNNPNSENKINLVGLAIGNGLTDPINQINYGSFLNGINLIDSVQKARYDTAENLAREAISSGEPFRAFMSYSGILGGPNSILYNTTGYRYVYNYLISENIGFDTSYIPFIENSAVRSKIHVGNMPYQMVSKDVYIKLIPDFTRSVAPWVSLLADNYRMMMYNGELDIVVAYPLTANYLNRLEWCGAREFATAERNQYRVGGELAGYIKKSAPDHCNGSIRLVMVRKAGHEVPGDQPLWAYNLISDFTRNLI